MATYTRLMSDEPLKDQERFDRPHGDECDCGDCLWAWARLVAARYIHVCRPHLIDATDLVLIVDARVSHDVTVWKRADYHRYLKALAVVRLEPHERLKPETDARPLQRIGL